MRGRKRNGWFCDEFLDRFASGPVTALLPRHLSVLHAADENSEMHEIERSLCYPHFYPGCLISLNDRPDNR